MQACEQHRITPEEYLAAERVASIRHEYVDGEVFAMAGASREHNQIVANLVRLLSNQLIDRPCSVFASDMKVKIKPAEKYTYPDVVVVCRKEEYADDKKDVLLNPILIIEILSDGTEAYDRGDKFSHYQLIPSLAEYILVSQYACKIERFTRQADGTWVYAAYHRMEDVLALASIQCELLLAEVYRKVEFSGQRSFLNRQQSVF